MPDMKSISSVFLYSILALMSTILPAKANEISQNTNDKKQEHYQSNNQKNTVNLPIGLSSSLARIFSADPDKASSQETITRPNRQELWMVFAGHQPPSPAVMQAIATAAATTGTDFGLLLAAAWKESGFRPNVTAVNSSATGLFQFTERTWIETLNRFGERFNLNTARLRVMSRQEIMRLRQNPLMASVLAAEAIKADGERLAQELGRPVTQYEAFMTHFLGYTGTVNFLRAVERTPNRDVREVISVAFNNNRPRFPQPQANGRITTRSAYNHLVSMLETRRTLYLQLLRLDVLLNQEQQITQYLRVHGE